MFLSGAETKGRAVSRFNYTVCPWRGHQPPHHLPGVASKDTLIRREVVDALLIALLYQSCTRPNAILGFEQHPSIRDIFIAIMVPVMAISNRLGQGQRHPEGSEEGTPAAPQTKGESQQAANAGETPGYGRNKYSIRMRTAAGRI